MAQNTPNRRMKIGVLPGSTEGTLDGGTPSFKDIQAMAHATELGNLDSFWMIDHLLFRYPGEEEGCWEALTFLSALAATTKRISLGPLVACTSFRNPALLAKMADSLDEISAGRFILGLGAGWHEPECAAFGYPYDHRASRFEEALQIIVPLLREGHVDFRGQYYSAQSCVLRQRGPSHLGPPIWIGTKGPRMLRLAAQYANAWNTAWHGGASEVASKYTSLLEACSAVGRDPETIDLTVGTGVYTLDEGASAKYTGHRGTPEEIALALKEYAEIGVRHLVVQVEPFGVESIERFSRIVELFDSM